MTEKRYDEYRRKCAEVDGYTFDRHQCGMYGKCVRTFIYAPTGEEAHGYPTYLDDASIDAVVRKLDLEQVLNYKDWLFDMLCKKEGKTYWVIVCLQATPEQKSEALARTLMGGKE